jgi:CDP-diacylglycerol--glycerol-3-phosphate 3-phosphatidyltransferase
MLSVLQAESTRADYVDERLRGTVWENSESAHLAYRACLAFGRGLGHVGISANMLTVGSLLLAGVAAVAVAFGHFVLGAAIVLASGAFDILDGVVARATGRATKFGALLDSTVDRLADGLPLLGLAVVYAEYGPFAAIPVAAMLGAFCISYVRARAESLGASLPPLFMRRAERVLLLTLSLLLSAVPVVAPVRAPLLLAGLCLMAVLNLAATAWALRAAYVALAPERVSSVHAELEVAEPVRALDAFDAKASAR